MGIKFSFEIEGQPGDRVVNLQVNDQGYAYHQPGAAPAPTFGDPEAAPGMIPPDDSSLPGGAQPLAGPIRLLTSGTSVGRGQAGAVSSPPDVGGPPPVRRAYSGFIVVRLSSLIPEPRADTLLDVARQLSLNSLARAFESFDAPPSARAVPGPDPHHPRDPYAPFVSLADLERRARQSALPPLHSLSAYWRVDGRALRVLKPGQHEEATREDGLPLSLDEAAELFVRQLNALSEVDLAYREIAAADPSAEPGQGPAAEELADFQLYLDRAPLGLDARWARQHLNGVVEGAEPVTVADLEQGWVLDHVDLQLASASPVHGDNRHRAGDYRGFHGTAVLSELVARVTSGRGPGALGVIGMVPSGSRVVTASHYRSDALENAVEGRQVGALTGTNGHVAAAIEALLSGGHLRAGDVLLLEVQRGGLPAEVEPLDFDAIRLAAANGVIVIEAAGNGGQDLDRLQTVDGRSLNRQSSGFVDSGAIMVGAASSAAPHERALFSSYGSRVDCFAWGDGVVAAGYGDFLASEQEEEVYTDRFSGTSSAAAMIAGAAILIQDLYQQNAGPGITGWNRLSPMEMRALLADPRNGTPQGRSVAGAIGSMPDLRKILYETLGIVPRVYLRDHVGDDGDLPGARRCFASPDIILTDTDALAAGFDEERDEDAAPPAPSGGADDARIVVRLRNRGLKAAKQVEVKLYCAAASTLVTPDRWRPVAEGASSIHFAEVPQGDVPIVSRPLAAEVRNHCLVAVAAWPGGPELPFREPCACGWSEYLALLRGNRNVAWRNVHLVEAAGSSVVRPFRLNGTADAARAFEFSIIQRLPREVTVGLRLPLALALKLSGQRSGQVQREEGTDDAVLHLPKTPRFTLGRVVLPATVDFPCVLELSSAESLNSGHSFAIQQLYQGEEVGRITWRFRAC